MFVALVLVATIGSSGSSNYVAPVAATPAVTAKELTPAQLLAARKAYAKTIDQQLLDMGIESKTYTEGSEATTLVIEDALAGRVRENAIQKNDDLFDQMRQLGFKHLKYTNNFDGDLNFGVEWKIQ